MTPNLTLLRDGKKFMWDGQTYDKKDDASRAAESYQSERFETETVQEGEQFLVYTRRVVKEVIVAANQ